MSPDTANLLVQLGRIVRHEEALERYLRECRGVTALAESELRDARLQRKNLTNQLLGREDDYPARRSERVAR
jgi:hypothetical protein